MIFKRIQPKRPMVKRKGNKVLICHYHKGMKQCLGAQCFWQRVGTCPIYNRIKGQKSRQAK
jgi:hypothetical protein